MNSSRIQTTAINKKTKQTINNALENALKRSNTTTTSETTAAATAAITTSTVAAIGASSVSVDISAVGGNGGCGSGEETIITINNSKKPKIEKQLKNEILINNIPTQFFNQKNQQQQKQLQQNKINNTETLKTISTAILSSSSSSASSTKLIYDQQQLSGKKEIGGINKEISLPANITLMDENKKIYTFATAGGSGVGGIGSGSGTNSSSSTLNITDTKSPNEDLIVLHNISGNSLDDPIGNNSNQGADNHLNDEYLLYTSGILDFEGDEYCINPSPLTTTSSSSAISKKSDANELSATQHLKKVNLNEVVSVSTSSANTNIAKATVLSSQNHDQKMNQNEAIARNIQAEDVQLVMMQNTGGGGPSNVVVGKDSSSKQNIMGNITKLENVQLKSKIMQQQQSPLQQNQQPQSTTTTMLVTTSDLRNKAVTYSRIGNLQTTSTGPFTATTILNRVNMQTALKNQPLIVTTKRVSDVNSQPTAKVSIGNTTISVPLLKPMSSHLIQTSGGVVATGTAGSIAAATAAHNTELTKLNSQPVTLNASSHFGKILNIKRGPKNTQPTIVSLSQLQIKPVSSAKIVQAKVVGKKMPIQLSNATTMALATSSTSVNTNSGIVTISAAKPKPISSSCSTNSITTSTTTHLHNLTFQKAPQMSIIPDSTPPQTLLECEASSTESSEPMEVVTVQIPPNKIAPSNNNENLQMLLLNKGPVSQQQQQQPQQTQSQQNNPTEKVSLTLDSSSNSNVLKNVLAAATAATNKSSTPPSLAPLSKHMDIKTPSIQLKANINSSVSIVKQSTPRLITTSAGEATIVSTTNSVADGASSLQGKVGISTSGNNQLSDTLKTSTAAVINIPRNISLSLAKSSSSNKLTTASTCVTTTLSSMSNSQTTIDTSAEQHTITNNNLEFLAKKLHASMAGDNLNPGLHRSSPQPIESPVKQQPSIGSTLALKQNDSSNSSNSSAASALPPPSSIEQKLPQLSDINKSTQITLNSVQAHMQLKRSKSTDEVDRHSHQSQTAHTSSISNSTGAATITYILSSKRHSVDMYSNNQTITIQPQKQQQGIISSSNLLPDGIIINKIGEPSFQKDNLKVENSIILTPVTQSSVTSTSSSVSVTPNATPPPPPPKSDESYNVLLKKLLQNNSSNSSQNSNHSTSTSSTTTSSSTTSSSLSSALSSSTLSSSISTSNSGTISSSLSSSVSLSSAIAATTTSPMCNQLLSNRKVINVRAPSLGLVSSLEAQLARPVLPPVPTVTPSTQTPLMSNEPILSSTVKTTTITQEIFKKQNTKPSSQQSETLAMQSSNSGSNSVGASGNASSSLSASLALQQSSMPGGSLPQITNQQHTTSHGQHSQHSQHMPVANRSKPVVQIISKETSFISFPSQTVQQQHTTTGSTTNLSNAGSQTASLLVGDSHKNLVSSVTNPRETPPQELFAPTSQPQVTQSQLQPLIIHSNSFPSINKTISISTKSKDNKDTTPVQGQHQTQPNPPPPYKMSRATNLAKEQGRKTPIDATSDDSNSSNSKLGSTYLNSNASNSNSSITSNQIKSPIPSPVSKSDSKSTTIKSIFTLPKSTILRADTPTIENLNLIATNPPSQLPNEIFQTDNNDSNSNQFSNDFKSSTSSSLSSSSTAPAVEFGNSNQQQTIHSTANSSAMSETLTLKAMQQPSTNVFASSLQQVQNQSKQQQQPQSVHQIVIQKQQKTPSTPSTPTPSAISIPTPNQIAQNASQTPPPPPPYSSAITSTSFTSSPQVLPTTPTQTPASTPTTPSTNSQASTSLNATVQNQQQSVVGTPSSSVKASPETPQKADAEMRKKRKREYQKNRRQIINSNKEQNQSSASATGRGSLSPSAATSTTPTSKKRARKVSKFEEDYDSFIDNLMTHIRSMQPLEIMEPDLSPNLAMHTIYGAIEGLKALGVKEGDFSKMDKYLVGDFGNALPENCENIYESPAAFRASKTHQQQVSTNHNKFYDQEFQPITHKKKEDKISKLIAAIRDRNLDTLELITSATSKQGPSTQKENMLEENRKWSMDLDYPGLYFTNKTNTHCFGRMSPIVPYLKPYASRKRNCYVFEPLKELDVELCSTEIKEETMDVDMETNISEKIKKEVDTESIVLALHPSVANSIIDVLQDLAKLLQVSPAIAYKIIEAQQDGDDGDDVDLSDIKGFKTEEECEESQTAALINLQKLITGQIRLCRQCGQKAGEIQVLVEHHMNYYLKPNMEIDIKKPIGSYLYFCSEKCQTQYSSGDVTAASSPLNSENNENMVLKVEQEGETSNEAKRKHPAAAACNNASSANGGGPTSSEPVVKRKRYKYFTPSNQTLGPALYKRPSEKEVTDLLFKMDITLSAYMSDLKDNRQCVFCHHFGDGLADGPSRLLNFDVDKWVHLNCALWSNGVYETISGGLMNFQAALQAGFNQTCNTCQEVGATVKCFKNRCGAVYHLPCAIKDSCTFYKNKTIHCQPHASRLEKENELQSLAVHRRVFVERDENRQVATVMHYSDSSNLLRVGSLTFLNVGQLLPHQLEAFHTSNYIYPIGYKMVRMYWSMRRLNKRCRYVCSIDEDGGRPEFRILAQEPHEEDIEFRGSTPKAVWQQVLESIANLRKEIDGVQLFPSHINGEDLFGLTEPAIVRIIESLPGVETLTDYRFKYGRNPLLELPLAINPSGAARTEPKQRQLLSYRKPHTQRTAGVSAQRFPNTTAVTTVVTGEMTCPYSKQFVHSKSSQYKKMKQEWRNNVYLARSKIQGLGLYAARDLEKHTMIIEYIGEVIRTEVSEIREKQYEARNRGIYMFRLDEDRVVDATLSGGLARYINHSCNPNCCTEIVEVDREYRIIIFAKRRIHRGEELSYDYKFDIEDDANKISCMCGAPNCRKWMN